MVSYEIHSHSADNTQIVLNLEDESSIRIATLPEFDAMQFLSLANSEHCIYVLPFDEFLKNFNFDLTYEEGRITQEQPLCSNFDHTRARYASSLELLVSLVWNQFNLPTDGLVYEMGSGSTGYYFAHLKPKNIEDKKWIQFEPNPNARDENKRRNPHADVRTGSYYQIPVREASLLTGLSSLDAPFDISYAIKEIATALKRGGYFLHIQDVSPGACGWSYTLKQQNMIPTVVVSMSQDLRQQKILGFSNGEYVNGVYVPFEVASSIEAFKIALQTAVHYEPRLNLVTHAYVTHRIPLSAEQHYQSEFFSLSLGLPLEHVHPYGITNPRKDTTILVTILQKK